LALPPSRAAVAAVTLPAGATPPGKNGKLVFERGKRAASDIFTVDADGSGLTRLTRLRGFEGYSSWSPDGGKLAFVRARNPKRFPYEIWVVNADGSGLERLTGIASSASPRPGRRTGARSCMRPTRVGATISDSTS
jgi:WD40-like Beta Propeller Repeat